MRLHLGEIEQVVGSVVPVVEFQGGIAGLQDERLVLLQHRPGRGMVVLRPQQQVMDLELPERGVIDEQLAETLQLLHAGGLCRRFHSCQLAEERQQLFPLLEQFGNGMFQQPFGIHCFIHARYTCLVSGGTASTGDAL